jgi:hypothetical protein
MSAIGVRACWVSKPDPETRSATDAYQGRVEAVLIPAGEVLSARAVEHVQRLVDHGEPSEGLLQLARAISNSRARVPAWIVASIRELSADLVPPEMLPKEVDDLAV